MNCSSENTTEYVITLEQYELYKFGIYLICLPIICLVGIVGNSLSLYILQKYPTKHAFATYLKALTGADIVLLCTALLRFLSKLFLHLNLKHASAIDAYGNFYCGIILGSLFQRLSSTFITVISLERFLAVCFPFKIRTMFIEARPLRIIAIMILSHIIFQVPTFIVVEVKDMSTSGNTTQYIISRTSAAGQQPILTVVYLFSIAVLAMAIPLIFVLITTCCIIVKIKLYRTRDIMKYKVGRGSLETERMTLTLIVMATFFTVITVPGAYIFVRSAVDRSVRTMFLRQLFTDITILLTCINSGTDFIIYCMTSNRFRGLFFESIARVFRKKNHTAQENVGGNKAIETISSSHEEACGSAETSIAN